MMGVPSRIAPLLCGLVMSLWPLAVRAELVVVVSAHNPLKSLSRAELSDIYLGPMQRLPNGERIVPIDQKDSAPAYEEFYGAYLGRSLAQITAHWSKLIFTGRGQPPRAVPDGGAAADIVAQNPQAIAYLDRALVDERLRIVPIE
jgi:ABC-type phosphate transport system substrate-binding protein